MGLWNPIGIKEPEIADSDRPILRALAKQVAEIAAQPIHAENAALWSDHNDLKPKRPMVLVFPEGSWRELIPPPRQCQTELAQYIESNLRAAIYYDQYLKDDNPITNEIRIGPYGWSTGYGLDEKRTKSEDSTGADHFEPVIHSMADIEKMTTPELVVDEVKTQQRLEIVQDVLGDILDVKFDGFRGGLSPIDDYAKLRGIDHLFFDMMDEPELIHAFCRRLVDGEIALRKEAEKKGLLSLDLTNHYAGSGGNCYTNQLPQDDFDGVHVRMKDLWAHATAQIFTDVSPDMHEEFAVQHEKRFLDLYGLSCYGCCEPLHHKLDMLIRNIPNLRRVSISPWADIEKSAEVLQNKYVYSWKPNPAILAGEAFNPERVRKEIRDFCEKTRGCVTEIIMKDTHTVRHQPERMHEWVRIAKEIAAEFAV